MNAYQKIRVAIGKAIDSGVHYNFGTTADSIGKKLGLSERMIQYTHIELRNSVFEPEFKKIPYDERVLFLPHCARNSKSCIATSDDEGYHCAHCGACEISHVEKFALNLGYKKVFIVPGGSMVKKILTLYKPKASVGVCCFDEALLAFDLLKNTKIIPQVALLLRDGCKDTMINVPLLEEKLALINETILPKTKKK
jgi:uncharacterized protein